MRANVTRLTGFIEFLTDHLTGTSGHILIKASPLMAPLPSAIFIFIALLGYAGDNILLIGAAVLLTFVIEGLGYAAVHTRNQIEDHNRRLPTERVDSGKATAAVRVYFVVTEAIILGFETVPAWIAYGHGGDLPHAIVATVILIFPVFSYVGSNIYSLMDILDTIQAKADARVDDVIHGLRAEIARLQQSLADAESRHKSDLANLANSAEIATQQTVANLTRQLEDRHRADTAEMATELRILRRQLEQYERMGTANRQPAALATEKNELTPGERQRCEEVAKIVTEHTVRTWKDLEVIAGWAQKTAERYGKLAKDAGYIAKDATGVYRTTRITSTLHQMPVLNGNGTHG